MAFDQLDIKIKIGREDWYIGSDKYNYILGKKRTVERKKKGEKIVVEEFSPNSCSYFHSLEYYFFQAFGLLFPFMNTEKKVFKSP